MNTQGIWQELLLILSEEVGSRMVDTWLKAVTFSQWDRARSTVYLIAPNKFVKDWIVNNYLPLLTLHLERLLNVSTITLNITDQQSDRVQSVEPVVREPDIIQEATALVQHAKVPYYSNNGYSFESFVQGPNNALAYAAAQAVAQKPGVFYNPFFIYGKSGLGKTHLMHAIGTYIKESNPQVSIVYQPAERFVHEFINAIRFDKSAQFEAKYKAVDVLLIDDIQYIAHKEQTQEALFHLFNVLHANSKQIVFSSDVLPEDMKGITERLRSRFECGLIADIQEPSLETKVAIIKKKSDTHAYYLADDVAQFIATQAYNIRALEGALIRVMAFAHLTQQEVTLELAQKILIKKTQEKKKSIDLERIALAVGRHFGYSLTELRSEKRHKELVLARQVALYLMKVLTENSLHEIGLFLLRKNHSTVLHAFDKIKCQIAVDVQLAADLEQIKKKLV